MLDKTWMAGRLSMAIHFLIESIYLIIIYGLARCCEGSGMFT